MELIKEENNKKIFSDGNNKTYTMLNMGNYIGHKNRQWYYNAPEEWVLMFYDEIREDGKKIHIDALVDSVGNYIRFLINLGNEKRCIQLDHGRVFNDAIIKFPDLSDLWHGDKFIALDGDKYLSNDILLGDYLSMKPNFFLNGQIYNGELSNNDLIFDFLKKNEELKRTLSGSKKI